MAPRKPKILVEDDSEVASNDRIVNIKELDLSKLHPFGPDDKIGVKYIVLGRPFVGKSKLIEWILWNKRHVFPAVQVFSGTEDSNGFFGKIIPKSFIYNGLDVSNLKPVEDMKLRQLYANKYLKPRGSNAWLAMIIDDCTYDTKFLKKPIFQALYKNSRHWHLLSILSLQYCLDIKPDIRASISGVFIMQETNAKMRQKLYENYGRNIDSLQDFNDLMDQLTGDYFAMYIDNSTQSNELEDTVFFCKADLTKMPENWKLGCEEFWEFHETRYDPNNLIDN